MSLGGRAVDRVLSRRRQQARAAEEAGESAAGSIPRRAGGGPVRLSFAQERLWFLDRLQPGSSAYNIPVTLGLRGALDPAALGAALDELVRRQAALRSRMSTLERDGELVPVQEVEPPAPLAVPLVDLTALPDAPRRAEARRIAVAEGRRPFVFEGAPLARVRRVLLHDAESLLLVVLHHAVADGWSVGLLVRELAVLYAAFAAGRRPPFAELPEPPIDYADWAEWQRAWLAGGEGERQLAYWRRRLGGAPPLLELPTDRPRPPVGRHRGDRVVFQLDAATAAAVDALARRLAATPFVLLFAAFQAFLGRLAGAREVVVGTPVANRRQVETEELIGFFASTLAVRTDLGGDPTFAELVARVRNGWLDDFEHQDLPFEEVVAALAPPRDMSHGPVFQVLFALQNAPRPTAVDGGLTIARSDVHSGAAKFDLLLTVSPMAAGGLNASLEYDRDLFDRATAERWSRCLATLLAGAVAAPESRLADLPLLDDAARREVVVGFQPPPAEYPGPPLVHQLVAEQAAATPDAPAVRFEGAEISYRQLSRRAGALSAQLVAAGVGPETRVGVAMERSLELVVALLGVLGADAAYVPLDPGYPEERLAHMAGDALAGHAAPVLLTQPALAERFRALPPAGTRVIALAPGGAVAGAGEAAAAATGAATVPPPPRALPESPAYVIYTSGSTGRPKGAVSSHRAIRNRLLWMKHAFGLGPGDRVLQKTPYSFDVSVWELFCPLVSGACLVMARPGGHGDAAYLVRVIAEERLTLVHFVPSMLQAFLREPGVEELDGDGSGGGWRVAASGEALAPDLVRRFRERLPHVPLHNLYGPTEAAVEVSWWPCEEAAPKVVPIGRPLPNLRLHVVDRQLRPQPIGVPGELLIGGVGLARGYHARPGLTAERWVPDPFVADFRAGEPAEAARAASGGRLYRTGDLARWRADGSVEYLGRLDHQVKLRGVRIELGEVESALLAQPQVAAAAAGVREVAPGDGRLVAWIVPREAAAGEGAAASEGAAAGEGAARRDASGLAADLRAALRRQLPDAMVPTLFVTLPALPLTPAGKIDRRALPGPELDGPTPAARWREPETAAEKLLAEVWAEVLRRERVGAGDDFFALGGHSLLATQVVARLEREIGLELPLRQIFETPVLADLAAAVDLRLLAEEGGGDESAAAATETEALAAGAGGTAGGDGSREVVA